MAYHKINFDLKDDYVLGEDFGCGPTPLPLTKENIFGIEVEVEGYYCDGNEEERGAHTLAILNGWHLTEDSSLRNGGVEFVSNPMYSSQVASFLNRLYDAMPSTVDYHERAGIHVHVNCLGMTAAQIRVAVCLYLLYENGFFRFVSPHRRNNIFCVPAISCNAGASLLHLCNDGSAGMIQKYLALNLTRLTDIGTIEFRHMESTNDKKKLLQWVGFIDQIWGYAREYQGSCDVFFDYLFDLTRTSQFETLAREVFRATWDSFSPFVSMRSCNNSIASLKMGLRTMSSTPTSSQYYTAFNQHPSWVRPLSAVKQKPVFSDMEDTFVEEDL
jgi:hypothetical protein